MAAQSYRLDRAKGVCTIELAAQFMDYPLADLESWVGFYDRQRERFPKSSARYDALISLLEEALAERDAI